VREHDRQRHELLGLATGEPEHHALVTGTVTVDAERCKGCELCIPACPPDVLAMSTDVNHMGYRFPQLFAGCTGCAACLYVCPDFVFEVFRQPRAAAASAGASA